MTFLFERLLERSDRKFITHLTMVSQTFELDKGDYNVHLCSSFTCDRNDANRLILYLLSRHDAFERLLVQEEAVRQRSSQVNEAEQDCKLISRTCGEVAKMVIS